MVIVLNLAQSKAVPQKVIGPGDFKTLVGAVRHQGIGARVSPYPLAAVADILEAVQAGDG